MERKRKLVPDDVMENKRPKIDTINVVDETDLFSDDDEILVSACVNAFSSMSAPSASETISISDDNDMDDVMENKRPKIDTITVVDEIDFLSDEDEILVSACVNASNCMSAPSASKTISIDDDDNDRLALLSVTEPLIPPTSYIASANVPAISDLPASYLVSKPKFVFKTPFLSRFQQIACASTSATTSASTSATTSASTSACTSACTSASSKPKFVFKTPFLSRFPQIACASTSATTSAATSATTSTSTSACTSASSKPKFVFKTPFLSRFPQIASGSTSASTCTSTSASTSNPAIWHEDGDNELFLSVKIPEAGAFQFQHDHDSVQRVLKEKFKLSAFRPMQQEIIRATLAGKNCLVVLPTSGGKSLCFQLPAVMHEGVTIVVSPLKSLMLDQVSKLSGLGICAVCMGENSNLVQVYRDLSSANPLIKLLYTTPEMLCINARFRNLLQEMHKKGKLARFVFDEAHCIIEGTSEFRPQYKKLHFLGNSFQSVPFMALTATGSPRILTDIKNCLGIQNWISFKSSVDRPNLKYIVNVKRNTCLDDCIDLIRNTFRGSSGIIYCYTQSDCDKTATKLKQVGISAAAYHAGLPVQLRNSRQTLWTNNAIQVMVATVAFGMGIDKPDVRFVIHLTIPKSIEGYYQECGRAGRDGKNSTCILFYRFSDSFQLMSLAEPKKATCMEKFLQKNDKEVKDKIDSLLSMLKFCEDRCTCRRTMLLNYFGDDLNTKCNGQLCDNCESNCFYSSVDVTSFAQAIVEWIGQLPKGSKPVCFGSLVEILKGSKCKRVLDEKYECLYIYGLLKSWKKNSVERFVQKLIIDKLLLVKFNTNSAGYRNAFIAEGDRSNLVKQDDFALSLALPTENDSSIVRDNDSEDELSDDFETDK